MPRRRRSSSAAARACTVLPKPMSSARTTRPRAGGENGAPRLVGQQFGLEHSIQRILSTAKFRRGVAVPTPVLRKSRFRDPRIRERRCRSPHPDRHCETPPAPDESCGSARAATIRPDRSTLRRWPAEPATAKPASAIGSQWFLHIAARWKSGCAHSPCAPARRRAGVASRRSSASMCLHVPRVLTRKSGHEQ